MASTALYAQTDYCKQIKKEVTDNNTSFSYETPYTESAPPAVRASRNFGTTEDGEFDNFALVLTIPCEFQDLLVKSKEGNESEKEEYKIAVEFDDKTKITDDTTLISHDKKGDGSALRYAYFPVNNQNIKALTTKKIVRIYLATAKLDVPADMATAMQQYLICLKNTKK